MKTFAVFTAFLTLGIAVQASAVPINPKPGEGKYAFCQRMYDSCMEGVFGKPGSQSYNVGRARCYSKWKSCIKTKTWNVIASAGDRIDAYGDEFAAQLDAERAE